MVDLFDDSISFLLSKLYHSNQDIPQTLIIDDSTYNHYLGNPTIFAFSIRPSDLVFNIVGKAKLLANLLEQGPHWYPEEDLICIGEDFSKYLCYISKSVCEKHGFDYGIINGKVVIWYKNTQPQI